MLSTIHFLTAGKDKLSFVDLINEDQVNKIYFTLHPQTIVGNCKFKY